MTPLRVHGPRAEYRPPEPTIITPEQMRVHVHGMDEETIARALHGEIVVTAHGGRWQCPERPRSTTTPTAAEKPRYRDGYLFAII